MADNELHIESFAAWVLAAQIASGIVPSGGTTPPETTVAAATMQRKLPTPVQQSLEMLEYFKVIPNATKLDIRLTTMSSLSSSRPTTARPPTERTAAYTVSGSKAIYILTDSPTFRKALTRDKLETLNLAGYIAHEWYHLQHGPDEKGAYEFQEKALFKMNAPRALLQGVVRAKNIVLKGD